MCALATVTASGEEATPHSTINARLKLVRGNIASLEVDAIVNANETLLGGGGADQAIHATAGGPLWLDC